MAVVADSAVVLGTPSFGADTYLAQGAVVRAHDAAVSIGSGSAFLENSVMVGWAGQPVTVGRKTVFGHLCVVIGATLGDLCEIGNASIIMPGARLGDRCFLGEGTLIPAGTVVPDDAVVVGRPGRTIRTANEADIKRLTGLRNGDLSLPDDVLSPWSPSSRGAAVMPQLSDYKGVWPTVSPSAFLFPSAELTGDVVVGDDTIIGAGVRIIGDSHGPVRIGNRVQILEGTVLHLLPDNQLVIHDDVIIGPAAMIHGCVIGAGSVVEPGAIVCDWSSIGAGCVVTSGSVVKQRSRFGDGLVLEGFPAAEVGVVEGRPERPPWALDRGSVEAMNWR